MFKNKVLLITGGTGSFGNAILKKFLNSGLKEIRIFSRDENKQDQMRKEYNNDIISFFLGDVRNKESLRKAMNKVDFVFHAAALKQVPSCEFFPIEATLTNIIGTQNVIDVSIECSVKKIVCLSTDKAVYPINAMGISKAMMEKILISASRGIDKTKTIICGTRYGNVMDSRGSVIPLFVNQILMKKPISVTNLEMTRFIMSLDEAVELVFYAFKNGDNGEIFIQKSPATTINTLVKTIIEIFKLKNYPIDIIGTRHGEKLFETLLSSEELPFTEDKGRYFRLKPDSRDLNYKNYINVGKKKITAKLNKESYNSHNAKMLDVKELKKLLLGLDCIKNGIKEKN